MGDEETYEHDNKLKCFVVVLVLFYIELEVWEMDMIAVLYDYLGYILGGLVSVLCVIALVRILKKTKKGEAVYIEPVGVFKDLPDTVTGLQNREVTRDE